MKIYRNKNGECHRIGMPAVIDGQLCDQWVFNGRSHKINGDVFDWKLESQYNLYAKSIKMNIGKLVI